MKVTYVRSVYEKILDIKTAADIADSVIDYITLTENEAKALIADTKGSHAFPCFANWRYVQGMHMDGIALRVEGL